MKQAFLPDARKQPLSGAVRAGDYVFVSGQVGTRGLKEVEDVVKGIEPQLRQAIENMKEVLETTGSSLNDVVKATFFLTNGDDFTKMKEVWQEYFPKDYPALSTIVVAFVNPNLLLELECIAYCPQPK